MIVKCTKANEKHLKNCNYAKSSNRSEMYVIFSIEERQGLEAAFAKPNGEPTILVHRRFPLMVYANISLLPCMLDSVTRCVVLALYFAKLNQ